MPDCAPIEEGRIGRRNIPGNIPRNTVTVPLLVTLSRHTVYRDRQKKGEKETGSQLIGLYR